jgi:hypothetical protein
MKTRELCPRCIREEAERTASSRSCGMVKVTQLVVFVLPVDDRSQNGSRMVSFAELQPDIGHPDDGSSMSRILTFPC